MTDIAKRIKDKRKQMKLTQTELGVLVGATPQGVSSWERGITKPKGKYLTLLANVLEVEEKWLLDGINEIIDVCRVPFRKLNENEFTKTYPLPMSVIFATQDSWSNVQCIEMQGNSMSPLIPDGAILAINTESEYTIDGGVYLLETSKGYMVRECRDSLENMILSCKNPNYQDEIIPLKNRDNKVKVVGRAFWFSAYL
ncbi:helix-turn-helix domain-containing protein [Vibrio owensii]